MALSLRKLTQLLANIKNEDVAKNKFLKTKPKIQEMKANMEKAQKEATAIHSNGTNGILAYAVSQVVIHLPSYHNTSYNNTREDRKADTGGTITNVVD